MNLDRLMAVSGKSGIYRMASNRSNGLVLQDLDNGQKFFVSGRLQEFTPLDSVSIYTLDADGAEGTVELKQVFANMIALLPDTPPPGPKASSQELRDYFSQALPEHNQLRVMISDIKKILKWFGFLHQRNLLA